MKDFTNLLEQMVVHKKGRVVEAETIPGVNDPATMATATSSVSKQAGMKVTMRTIHVHFNNLQQLTEDLINTVNSEVEKINTVMQPMMEEMKRKIGSVKTTFGGLKHLSTEQQQHIMTMTQKANGRIKELKKTLNSVRDLLATTSVSSGASARRVEELEQQLAEKTADFARQLREKELEMEGQEQDFNTVFDYYEAIMLKMKRENMNAKQKIKELQDEMDQEYDFEPMLHKAHYQPEGPLVKETRKSKKKKLLREQMQNYGTFNLEEHLQKMREKDGFVKDGADW